MNARGSRRKYFSRAPLADLTLPLAIIYPEVEAVQGEAAVPLLGVAPHLVFPPEHSHRLPALTPPTLAHLGGGKIR